MSEAMQEDNQATPRSSRATRVGTVVSDKCDKTIKVECRFMMRHPKYGKYMHRRTNLQAHDPENTAKVGDLVELCSSRRFSKAKCWRLVKVIKSDS